MNMILMEGGVLASCIYCNIGKDLADLVPGLELGSEKPSELSHCIYKYTGVCLRNINLRNVF